MPQFGFCLLTSIWKILNFKKPHCPHLSSADNDTDLPNAQGYFEGHLAQWWKCSVTNRCKWRTESESCDRACRQPRLLLWVALWLYNSRWRPRSQTINQREYLGTKEWRMGWCKGSQASLESMCVQERERDTERELKNWLTRLWRLESLKSTG